MDEARKRYAVLKRKLETEFGQLDTMASKVDELEAIRKVRLTASQSQTPHTPAAPLGTLLMLVSNLGIFWHPVSVCPLVSIQVSLNSFKPFSLLP